MDAIEDDSDLGSFFIRSREPYFEIDRWIHDWALRDGDVPRNSWFRVGTLQVYMRLNSFQTRRVEIGNVMNDRKGQGDFRRFIEWLEKRAVDHRIDRIRIENVLNPRFAEFFLRRDYSLEPNSNIAADLTPCFIKDLR